MVPALVLAALLPTMPRVFATTDRAPVPEFITTGAWRQCAPEGGVIVPVPLPTPGKPDAMRWPAAANAAFAIPEGFEAFEAIVGLDHSTRGRGSIIASVRLDDQEVFRSPRLTGTTPPASVHVLLGNARVLTLRTDPTEDGNSFDHTDWADAQLLRKPPEPTPP